jgi:hypothetical protein
MPSGKRGGPISTTLLVHCGKELSLCEISFEEHQIIHLNALKSNKADKMISISGTLKSLREMRKQEYL